MNIEFTGREELRQLQIERLQTTLNRAYRNVSFYRQAFDAAKVEIESVRGLDDLRRLPFTGREDLAASYPYGMFAVPLRDIVRIHAGPEETDKPIAVGFTRNDINHWADLVVRQLIATGMTEHDAVQIAFDYGLSTAGLGFHYGAERLGASVIPASSGRNVRRQAMIMRDYKATVLITTPGHAAAIAGALEELGINPVNLQLRIGIFGGEPWSETFRADLEQRLHLEAYDAYGAPEILGPGVAAECGEHCGLHVSEDHFILEIIDPQTLEPVKPGDVGELVLTTIAREAFPLIRYRSHDLARLMEGACPCGRIVSRISRIAGRTDDLIVLQGARVFPSRIGDVLIDVMKHASDYRIVIDRKNDADTLELRIALSDADGAFDDFRTLDRFRIDIAERLERTLSLDARVTFVEPGSLQAGGRMVVDKRK